MADRAVSFQGDDGELDAHNGVLAQAISSFTSLFESRRKERPMDSESRPVSRHTAGDPKAIRERKAARIEKATQITFECTTEDHQTKKAIVLCQDQTFEDFMDFIQNEFGTRLWPATSNPLGGIMLIDSDYAFEMLVKDAETRGNMMSVTVVDGLHPEDEVDEDDDDAW